MDDPFVQVSSKHLFYTQNVRARELKFSENVQPPNTCQVSHPFFLLFFDKVVGLVGGGSVVNGTNLFNSFIN